MKIKSRTPAPCRVAATAAATVLLFCPPAGVASAASAQPSLQVQLADGLIEGKRTRARETDLRVFLGIPYAAPPTGPLRWREPQSVERWAGVRGTVEFGPRCAQPTLYSITFRSTQMSEDCLYLNVWTPASGDGQKLPVLVYFHGGNFDIGDGSQPLYDGANLAARGIVTITLNYRLGAFGFLALPELGGESPHGKTGNYGLLDQHAALEWIRVNVAAFGGDPDQVTIAGDSAGAFSVSAHVASPLSRGLFARAIGLSGGAFAPLMTMPQRTATSLSNLFLRKIGRRSVASLRAMSTATLVANTVTSDQGTVPFWPSVDGRFLPKPPAAIFRNGSQAQVPLLVGSNLYAGHYDMVLDGSPPTPQSWQRVLRERFGNRSGEALSLYPGDSEEQIKQSAAALATDDWVSHAAWRWMDMHRQTSLARIYFYGYTHHDAAQGSGDTAASRSVQPTYANEAVFALDNLDRHSPSEWSAEDHEVSRVFSGYVEQFVKDANPNRAGLPIWPSVRDARSGSLMRVIGADAQRVTDDLAARHTLLEARYADEEKEEEQVKTQQQPFKMTTGVQWQPLRYR